MALRLPLPNGVYAIIDDADADLGAWRWCGPSGYAHRRVKRVTIWLHRVVLERALGRDLLPTEEVDHRNGDTLDNRRCNLRPATTAQNSFNLSLRRDSKTGVPGVTFHPGSGRFQAGISKDRRHYYLGLFDTIEEARMARERAEIELFGQWRRAESEGSVEHIANPETLPILQRAPMRRYRRPGKLGIPGVCYVTTLARFTVSLRNADGRRVKLGQFRTLEEAVKAREAALAKGLIAPGIEPADALIGRTPIYAT